MALGVGWPAHVRLCIHATTTCGNYLRPHMASMPTHPGVYALRHRASKKLYIGSTKNLTNRFSQWRAAMRQGALPPVLRHLSSAVEDWDFIVIKDATGLSLEDRLQLEQRAIEQVTRRDPTLCLNHYAAAPIAAGSLRALSAQAGIARSTLQARLKAGWTPREATGQDHRPVLDRSAQYRDLSVKKSAVVIVDGNEVLGVSEAARRLGCRTGTLRERLQKFRVTGGQGRVRMDELRASSDRYRRDK